MSCCDQMYGTCLVVGAALMYAIVAFVVNTDPLPLLTAAESRFFVSWVVSSVFMLFYRKSRGLHWFGPPQLRGMLLLKATVSFSFITLWWAALRRAPIGDCIAIIYCAPVLTSVVSFIVLREALPRGFPLQVILVLAGSILVLDPPFLRSILDTSAKGAEEGPRADYTLTVLALLFGALAPLVTSSTKECSWIEVEHVSAAAACLFLDPALACAQYSWDGLLPMFPVLDPWEVLLIVLAAAGSFVAIAMETKGYQLAEPGKASMYRYVEIPFAYMLQHAVAGTEVQPRTIAGAALIISSCAIGALSQARGTRALSETAEPLLKGADSEP